VTEGCRFSTRLVMWSLYWRELAGDFAVLVACGQVQAIAREAGHDHPAGFFYTASRSYAGDDHVAVIARRALMYMGAAFEEGRPS